MGCSFYLFLKKLLPSGESSASEILSPLPSCSPPLFHKKFSFLLAPSAAAKQYLHQFPLCKRGRRKKRTHFPSWSFASKGGEKSEQMHTPTHIFCTQTRSNKCWAGAEKGERESALLCVIIHATPHPFPTPIAIPPTHRPHDHISSCPE